MPLFKPAYTLFLKTGTFCNADCVSCPAGRKRDEDKESGGYMRPDMMERILAYVKKQGRIISATHHYYNEPTFNPWIAELIRICHQHGVYCLMSTNGSNQKPGMPYNSKLREVLEAGLTNLIFSVSGWTQETHERSHKGVSIEDVRRNMRMTSDFVRNHRDFRGGKMFVRVSWHNYAYNESEAPLMRRYTENLGFRFTPYNTGLLPLEQAMERMEQAYADPTSPEHPGERDLRTKMKDAVHFCRSHANLSCDNQHRKLTIDSDGYLHNCCVKMHDANRRTLLFDTDLEEFNRFRKEEDEDCKWCKSKGYAAYAQQTNEVPNTRTFRFKRALADIWKSNNMGGKFPWVSAKYSQLAYVRRQGGKR